MEFAEKGSEQEFLGVFYDVTYTSLGFGAVGPKKPKPKAPQRWLNDSLLPIPPPQIRN